MKIHRFYIPNIDISPENTYVTHETELIHQLKNVFRYKIGQKIHIFNEKDGEIEVEIGSINKKDISFYIKRHLDKNDLGMISKKDIVLYMSVIKNSNFDLVVEKCVEIGVKKIIPVTSERVIKNKLNYERLNKIIKEATEQCGRVDLMEIGQVSDLKDAVIFSKTDSNIVYYGSIDDNLVQNNVSGYNKVSLFIGPEGGFTEKEIDLFKQEGVLPIRFGQFVLRAETAAIVACGYILK